MCYTRVMIRTYAYQLKPTVQQAVRLTEVLALNCEVYNAALEARIHAYKREGKTLSAFDLMKEFTEVRQIREDQAELFQEMARFPIKTLDLAFQAFFKRLRANKGKAGFPRFKSHKRYHTMTFPKGVLIRENGKAYLPKLGEFKVNWHRDLPQDAKIKQVKVTRKGKMANRFPSRISRSASALQGN